MTHIKINILQIHTHNTPEYSYYENTQILGTHKYKVFTQTVFAYIDCTQILHQQTQIIDIIRTNTYYAHAHTL